MQLTALLSFPQNTCSPFAVLRKVVFRNTGSNCCICFTYKVAVFANNFMRGKLSSTSHKLRQAYTAESATRAQKTELMYQQYATLTQYSL